MFYNFKVKDKEYKLRLATRDLIKLEDKLGMNPIYIFGKDLKHPEIPKTKDVLTIIAAAFNDIPEEQVYDIIDEWLEEGHSSYDLVEVASKLIASSKNL